MNQKIVNTKWLNDNLADPNLVLLDASQPNNKSGTSAEFDQLQIEGTRAFKLKEEFSLKTTSLPNMLPDAEQFEKACRNIGINATSKIVVYDNLGIYFSPRVWWMFKTMGHQQVFVLNGGLPHWIIDGYTTEPKIPKSYETGDFSASLHKNSVKTFDFIKNNIETQEHVLIDARSSNRFNGLAPEPRKGLRSGNIKNSINLPFEYVLENGKFKSNTELAELFDNLQIGNRPLTFTCGSGVTACIILLAAELIRENEKSIYDGSWTEWAQRTQA